MILLIYFRHGCFKEWIDRIEKYEGGVSAFTQAYKYYGIHLQSDNSVIAREWAPGAAEVFLTGDFSKTKKNHSKKFKQ